VVEYRGGGVLTGRIGGRRFRFEVRRVDTTPPEIELGAASKRKPDLQTEWPRPKFAP
jgi:hypothetical protein